MAQRSRATTQNRVRSQPIIYNGSMIRPKQPLLVLLAYSCLAVVVTAGARLPAQDAGDYRMIESGTTTVFEDGVTPRAGVRVNFYNRVENDPWHSSPGQVAIEYGTPVWKEEYIQLFEQFPTGKQWRMGSNFWTNLWTSFALSTGERRIQPGFYFLVLERTDSKSWSLVAVEPSSATRLQMDPWHVGRKDLLEGTLIPLEWKKTEQIKEKLEIMLKARDDSPKQLVVHIRFGPFHFWSQPLTAAF